MKKLILSIAVLLFMGTTFVSANELNPKKSYERTTQELSKLLNPTSAVGELDNDVLIKVKIRITQNHEIVVLNTNSNNFELNGYIKEMLNYRMLESNELAVNSDYVFEVNFKS
jgi:hypothetical protein